MLRDGCNADEENQDADDVGLEPQDRIGVHGEPSTLGVSSRFAGVTGRASGTGVSWADAIASGLALYPPPAKALGVAVDPSRL
jgi:hypothetical protein